MVLVGESRFGLKLDVVLKDDLTYDMKIWYLHVGSSGG